jgi:hypothetical protein
MTLLCGDDDIGRALEAGDVPPPSTFRPHSAAFWDQAATAWRFTKQLRIGPDHAD